MTTARQDPHRKTPARRIQQAAGAVVEELEGRLFLSASLIRDPRSHMVVGVTHESATPLPTPIFSTPPKLLGSPSLEFPAGTIRSGGGGYTATQIRHLYGVDNLDAYNPAYPLFTNLGNNEVIVVIGGAAAQVNDTPVRTGNINQFSASNGVPGLNNPVQIDNTLVGGGLNPVTDLYAAIESTAQLEWAHAFAPAAILIFVEVPTTSSNPLSPNYVPGLSGGVILPNDLKAGLQQAITDLQAIQAGPINQFGPGGVVTMSLASVGEDPNLAAQYDAIFNQASAANISFIAPTGDYGSTLSMPATSPAVTAVGGTLYKIDPTGKRIYETASLPSGGGQSTVEPLPAFQQGVRAGKVALTTRSVPDISAISQTQGLGVDVFYDPTPNNTAPVKHYTEEGTSVSAPIIAGIVADANELRADVGLGPIGQQLNATLYQGFKQLPSVLYTDITQGNNILHHAVKGYDLATGVGVPKADSLIPYLAGIVSVTANVKFSGSFTTALSSPPVVLTTFRGVGTSQVGSQYISLNFPLNVAQTTGTTPVSAIFTPSLISRNPDSSFDGTGVVAVTSTTRTVNPVTGIVTTTTGTINYNVEITGIVRGRATSPQISGQIYTIDPLTGRRLFPGTSPVFQGSFRT